MTLSSICRSSILSRPKRSNRRFRMKRSSPTSTIPLRRSSPRHLDAGRDVAVICEGDPFFYGSYMYLHDRLAARFEAEVGARCVLDARRRSGTGSPLVYRNQSLSVLSGVLPEDELRRRLADADAAVVMKLGRNFDKVRRVLGELGLAHRALYVNARPWAISASCRSPKSIRWPRRIFRCSWCRGKMARMTPPAIVILGAGAWRPHGGSRCCMPDARCMPCRAESRLTCRTRNSARICVNCMRAVRQSSRCALPGS